MIRRATDQDLPALLALHDLSYPGEDDEATHSRVKRVFRLNPAWVSDENGIQGMLLSEISEGHPYIWSVATASAHRGRGVATSLIKEFEKHYASEGYKSFWLHVRTENPAQKVYFDNGYRVASFLQNLYGNRHHGLIMRKRAD